MTEQENPIYPERKSVNNTPLTLTRNEGKKKKRTNHPHSSMGDATSINDE
jgi:hypothetical protein